MIFKTPILFIIFNRPDTTQVVFDEIKKVKPERLFIAADGPRADKEENEKCQMTRDIIKQVNWDCDIHTLFREKNVGCKRAVSSAIDWFFENVEEGIILEDDCVPSQSFFMFCNQLLEHYRHDKRVMMISGDNFQNGVQRGNATYYFSRIAHIWGWATWRRAWHLYDANLKTFPDFLASNQISNVYSEPEIKEYWINCLSAVSSNKINTWDYQWGYTLLMNNGLSIMPNINLISNIGFGADATHVTNSNSELSNMNKYELSEKIIHPMFTLPNKEADNYTYINHYGLKKPTFKKKFKRAISSLNA
ncbi:MAG: nucleotide-diphospho-sugar transferase [Candidatus Margulisiibacteriota bacterium]|nr:MAG: hypothetical protein A2X43_10375 [Candidatus Margulisbacteria bacterium GWD2_39_127]OGI05415.1 MAG: hypothetical protein A2X42_09135 [Candidatus Margulisbacteria bacterium GWF2_38_17]PZM80097.1 MAG: nucleotide-diphospho-sugar transferase [Candidatus Margulisiibacteriota bacterium]HAR62639.1 nucleotide-diphospho-sugar transferase [Candidatus Margulisiibacteriota bacterium]